MNLQQASSLDSEVLMDILFENSRWLENMGVAQWPFDGLKKQQSDVAKSAEKGKYFKLAIFAQPPKW